ncbi:MAG TPA: ATP-binding protein [Blastocatellia bacterium]|nr:ATP-binding protein [Blastocatellia bacterium]
MRAALEFKFPSDPKWLKGLRSIVSLVCERNGFSVHDVGVMTLAVDEACANIMKHTYCGSTDRPIIARCVVNDERIEFQLEDHGPCVDPEKVKPRALDDLRPGGLGTHFINSAMDEVIYDTTGAESGNLLRLIKYKSRAVTKGSENGDQR